MALTPLTKELPSDLNEIKTLIDERVAAIKVNNEQVSALNVENDGHQKEIEILQLEVNVLTGQKARPSTEGITIKAEQPKVDNADNIKNP